MLSEALGDPLYLTGDSFDMQLRFRGCMERAADKDDLVIRLHVEFQYALEETMVRLPSLVMQPRMPRKIDIDI